jgi:hypothetical protein
MQQFNPTNERKKAKAILAEAMALLRKAKHLNDPEAITAIYANIDDLLNQVAAIHSSIQKNFHATFTNIQK